MSASESLVCLAEHTRSLLKLVMTNKPAAKKAWRKCLGLKLPRATKTTTFRQLTIIRRQKVLTWYKIYKTGCVGKETNECCHDDGPGTTRDFVAA